MSAGPGPAADALKFLGASPSKKVLIVEGPSDRAVYGKWLKRLAAPGLYSAHVEVVDGRGKGAGGGKSAVLAALQWLRDHEGDPQRVFGLVDRDEWDDATIQRKLADLSQLRVNARRHSLESYFCDPGELEPALLAINATWGSQTAALQEQIEVQRADYVVHWALLTTTERIKIRMVEEGYPGHFVETVPVPSDGAIQEQFQRWAGVLNHESVFQAFNSLRRTARAVPADQAYRSHIWAKRFFRKVVYAAPHGLQAIHNKSPDDWMVDLAEWAPQVPLDLVSILEPLLV